ncbi:MAG: thioesterase family protein [Firmicutes bacterium]|nr:thioesterase family protein [Bacillota bacterium]
MDIQIGKSITVTTKVDKTNTALAVGSGGLEVFGTPMMIALMEKSAYKVLEDSLGVGQTSVGIKLNVEHISASPLGADISAMATITAVDGRKVSFDLTARDNSGMIGKGTHDRFVIDSEKFMNKVKEKAMV